MSASLSHSPVDMSVLDVVVLAGGESAEREVSLRSGGSRGCRIGSCRPPRVGRSIRPKSPLSQIDWRDSDACFVALHGGAGEDGRVQQQLDALGVAYTGSGPEACRLAMSKSAAKRRFVECGVPTPSYVVIAVDASPAEARRRVEPLGFPLIVKPEAQGSSIGVSLVHDEHELTAALAKVAAVDRLALCRNLGSRPRIHAWPCSTTARCRYWKSSRPRRSFRTRRNTPVP